MTFVINQGMAMYWGTSRWSAMEIMVNADLTLYTLSGYGRGETFFTEGHIQKHI